MYPYFKYFNIGNNVIRYLKKNPKIDVMGNRIQTEFSEVKFCGIRRIEQDKFVVEYKGCKPVRANTKEFPRAFANWLRKCNNPGLVLSEMGLSFKKYPLRNAS